MSKKICKETDKEKIARQKKKAGYECKSCGSLAAKEKLLCKPKSL
jgi:translation initiation factor 2 beta subunit (eIF-2beta)/eIF-5